MRNATGIDVSKEEEKFLRHAFRRFALPYVLVFAVIAWIASALMSTGGPAGSPDDLASLRAKIAGLEESIAALEGRVDKVGTELERAGTRVGALESRKPAAAAPATDTSELERSLRDATRRVADLERRTSSAPAAERIDALVARMQRIESAVRSTAPPPAPAAPAPVPEPGP